MSVALLSFSARGQVVAERLAEALGGTAQRCGGAVSLSGWTKKAFDECDALVFVGAVGIAVRAIAPFVKDKATDPAVVAVDEAGHFAVPLLSGHLGGANDLGPAHRPAVRRGARYHHSHGWKRYVRCGRVGAVPELRRGQ